MARYALLASRVAIALLLIGAAVAKAAEIRLGLADSTFLTPVALLAVSQAELFLGVSLIIGTWRKQTLTATLVLFAGFGVYSLSRALMQYDSCGCFGSIKTNPWLMFCIDVSACVCCAFHLGGNLTALKPRPAMATVVCYLLIASPVGAVASSSILASDQHGVVRNATSIVLNPNKWLGRPLPISASIRPNVDLAHGEWIVLIHHHGCPKCEDAVPKYEALEQQESPMVLLLESPPFAASGPFSSRGAKCAWLADDVEWFVHTPVEIVVRDGVVVYASQDLPSINGVRSLPITHDERPKNISLVN